MKTLPTSLDVERGLLATLCSDGVQVKAVSEILPVSALFGSENRVVYQTLLDMSEENRHIDILTVTTKLKSMGCEREADLVIDISDEIVGSQKLESYCQILNEMAIRRKGIQTLQDIQNGFYEDSTIENSLNSIEELYSKLADDCDKSSIKRRKKGEVIRVKDLSDTVKKFRKQGFQNLGVNPGWEKMNQHYRPAKGTLNIVTGIPGHGKSELCDAIMINISLSKDWKWGVFSPENYPWEIYIQKLAEKLIGKGLFTTMTEADLDSAIEWIDKHFYLLDLYEDNRSLNALVNISLEAIEKHKLDGLIFDPWNEIEMVLQGQENETQYIGRSLSKLRRFARKQNIALFIVAHPAKMPRDQKTKKYLVPTLYDINGSANWYNRADNGVCVYRNFVPDNPSMETIDVYIQKIKFKVHGKVGCVNMRYNRESGRFTEIEDTENFYNNDTEVEQQTVKWANNE